ncbi:MAG: hypothetical protein ACK4HF_17860 [Paracoccaceae bacterium]
MERLSLREFIERREVEIKELRAALFLELKELKAAKIAIDSASLKDKPSTTAESSVETNNMTIKEMALHVLHVHGGTGTAEDIVKWIKAEFGKVIERSSLSPQLSRLKADERLDLDLSTGVWNLSESIKSDKEDFGGLDNGSLQAQTAHDTIRHSKEEF